MRTTIELEDRHRAALLRLAAERGEKGFSGVLNEAVEAYFAGLTAREEARQAALALRGRLARPEATRLRAATARLREEWR